MSHHIFPFGLDANHIPCCCHFGNVQFEIANDGALWRNQKKLVGKTHRLLERMEHTCGVDGSDITRFAVKSDEFTFDRGDTIRRVEKDGKVYWDFWRKAGTDTRRPYEVNP